MSAGEPVLPLHGQHERLGPSGVVVGELALQDWCGRAGVGEAAPLRSALGKCGGAGHNGMGVGELALSLLDGIEDEGELAQRAWTWAKAGSAPHLARAGAGLIVWMQERLAG